MGDITQNISRHEIACQCQCGFDTIDYTVIEALQMTADHFASVYHCRIWVDITSGCRCIPHNATIPGATDDSQHPLGRAIDFKLFVRHPIDGKRSTQVDPIDINEYLDEHHPLLGIGRYTNRNHIDSRTGGPARWIVK